MKKLLLILSFIVLTHISSAQWLTNGTSTYYNQGNVGINVSSPGKRLDVFGDMRIRGDVSTLNFYRTSSPADIAYIQYDQYNLNFNIATSGKTIRFINRENWTESMRITPYGAVGIGTTNPGNFKLAVEGKIGAREIQVTSVSPWPDFVFLKDYYLRPLSEVETYINENGHLPEIPSAKEVEENGINLGEMDAKLLQKIEELTLYMIELKKENEEMKERIKLITLEQN